jgi:glycosyltransferase involved in cell wall biosynthesis
MEKGGYPNPTGGSLVCYKDLSNLLSKDVEVMHLIDIPIHMLPLFYRKIKKHRGKLVYHIWWLPRSHTGQRLYAGFLQRFADAIACTSPRILNIFKKIVNNERLWLVPPPIDTNIFKPILSDRCSANKPSQLSVLYIGSLHPMRFPVVDVLVALKRIQETGLGVTLTVAGAPRYSFDAAIISKLRKLSEKIRIDLNIIYKIVPLDEKIRLYNQSDIVLFPYKPSVKDIVDPPITLLEAMSCSRVTVSTKVLSIPWIIKDRLNGILCNGLSYLHIYDALMNALSIPDKCLLQRNARKTILERTSYRAVSKLLYNLWNELGV